MQYLVHLNLADNRIASMDGLDKLSQLQSLNLEDNAITHIPASIKCVM